MHHALLRGLTPRKTTMPHVTAAGAEIFYQHRDHGAASDLIFIHESGGCHQSWPAEIMEISAANVYVLDLPGHGYSGGDGAHEIAPYAACVEAVVEALGLSSVVLCGHSLGGAITLQLALESPPWLSKIVLVGTGARLRVNPAILEEIQRDFAGAVEMMGAFIYGPNPDEALKARARETLLELSSAEVMRGDFIACDRFDVMDDLEKICVPTLVVAGSHDLLTPLKYSSFMAAGIKGAQLTTIEGAGHAMAQERPEVFCYALSTFLSA